jgi:hypothetical protein
VPPALRIADTTRWSISVRRAAKTVFAPAAANASAIPRPIPLLAPVTIATRSDSSSVIVPSILCWIAVRQSAVDDDIEDLADAN